MTRRSGARCWMTAGLILTVACGAAPPEAPPAGPKALSPAAARALWDGVLQRHVDAAGRVDYPALGRDPDFVRYRECLARTDPATLPGPADRLAFWLNAYNALTIQGVVDHWPVTSVKEVGLVPFEGFFEGLEFPVAGRELTLNAIEHEILRREFQEPRIHFAIVCASTSCPALGSRAYRPGDLEAQLEAAAVAFVNDPARNRVDPATETVRLSAIFDWFGEDFGGPGGVRRFVARRLRDPAARRFLIAFPLERIGFLEYDWSLNARPPAASAPGE